MKVRMEEWWRTLLMSIVKHIWQFSILISKISINQSRYLTKVFLPYHVCSKRRRLKVLLTLLLWSNYCDLNTVPTYTCIEDRAVVGWNNTIFIILLFLGVLKSEKKRNSRATNFVLILHVYIGNKEWRLTVHIPDMLS